MGHLSGARSNYPPRRTRIRLKPPLRTVLGFATGFLRIGALRHAQNVESKLTEAAFGSSTPFWDPIGNKCLCTGSSCQFTSQTRPIGPNGANLTGGGTGGGTGSSASAGASATSIYTPFSSDAFGGFAKASVGAASALFVAALSTGVLLLRKA